MSTTDILRQFLDNEGYMYTEDTHSRRIINIKIPAESWEKTGWYLTTRVYIFDTIITVFDTSVNICDPNWIEQLKRILTYGTIIEKAISKMLRK